MRYYYLYGIYYKKFMFILLTVSASLGYMTIGLIRGWSSTAIPSMESRDPYLIPNDDAASWVSAVPPLGAVVGSICAGPLLQHLGRKKTLLVSGPLSVIGWVVLGTGRTLYLVIIGRVITGICGGLVIPSAQVYVSECAFPEIRGILGSVQSLSLTIGILLSYIFGTRLEWDQLAYMSGIFPAVLSVLLMLLPESPVWLRNNNRHKEANRVLVWLNQKETKATESAEVVATPDLPIEQVETPSDTPRLSQSKTSSIPSVKGLHKGPYSLEALMRRSVLIPFGLLVGVLVFQQISGIDTIIFYTVSIFRTSGSTVDDYTATIIVGAVQVFATFLSLFTIDRAGRKPLLLVSGFLMAISMAVLGAYFHIQETNPTTASELGLVPILSLIVFVAAYSIGYCNIPYLLIGELLPLAQRSFLSSVGGAANLGSMFLIVKTYPDIKDALGSEGVFFTYAIFCLLSCVFVFAFLPETKQKTLEEIEEYFEMKNKQERHTYNVNLSQESDVTNSNGQGTSNSAFTLALH